MLRALSLMLFTGVLWFLASSASAAELTGTLELADMGTTWQGATFGGSGRNNETGWAVSNAGDVNGDGMDDLLIGGSFANSNSDSVYLVFGKTGSAALTGSIDLNKVGTEVDGVVFSGIPMGDFPASPIASAGDVNNDGFDDILIGTYGSSPNGTRSGATYLVYGSTSLSGTVPVATIGPSVDGAVFNGVAANDWSGFAVSGAGDINNDGRDDILIGAGRADPDGKVDAGETYLVYGQAGGAQLLGTYELSSIGTSLDGVVLAGIDTSDLAGLAVSAGGDINDDGISDLLIGADARDFPFTAPGEAYLIYGVAGGAVLIGNVALSDVGISVSGVTFQGIDSNDLAGISVSSVGDVNGDGIDDLLTGAAFADPNGVSSAGESYLIYGQSGPGALSGAIDLSQVGTTIAGAILNGIDQSDFSGRTVRGAGDINGDGLADLLVSGWRAQPNGINNAGKTYLIYGRSGASALSGSIDLSGLGIFVHGATFNGIDPFDDSSASVSGVGDINGDGYDDLLIGANLADPNGISAAGESYLIYGNTGIPEPGTIALVGFGGLALIRKLRRRNAA